MDQQVETGGLTRRLQRRQLLFYEASGGFITRGFEQSVVAARAAVRCPGGSRSDRNLCLLPPTAAGIQSATLQDDEISLNDRRS